MSRDPFLNQSVDSGDGLPMPALKAGQLLFNGRYELLQALGAGGMGVVWLARDHTEHAEVALKFLPSVLVLQESEMRRLREEVRAGKELRHPRIVATYGLEVQDGAAAIVMEYVKGRTLKELQEAQERGFFEPAELAAWAKDLGEAISYLHGEARRIHRDLKPANIIVDEAGRARLMDFGISRRIQEGVSRHSKTGEKSAGGSSNTLAYASPQQLAGNPAAFADDIYSLGAAYYELLSGAPPFFRGDADIVRGQIKHEPVTPLAVRRQELVDEGLNASVGAPIPAAVEKMLQACMAKEREARPASAMQVAECFDPARGQSGRGEGKKEAAAKRSQSEPAPARAKKRFEVLEWAAMVLVLAAVAGGWWVFFKPKTDSANSVLVQPAASQGGGAAVVEKPASVVTPAVEVGQDEAFTNSLGMKFVRVFTAADAPAVHFCVWETRSRDYAAFIKSGAYATGAEHADDWKTFSFQGCPVGRGDGESAAESSHPVVNVSPEDAAAFCAWLTQKERQAGLISAEAEYRLPTQAEWRSAAAILLMDTNGNLADASTLSRGICLPRILKGMRDGFATTAPVGSFPADKKGLHDMSGNVWEITLSSAAKTGRPAYVIAGSGWADDGPDSASLAGLPLPARSRTYDVGFRCILAKKQK